MTECPFLADLSLQKKNGSRWKLLIKDADHNHATHGLLPALAHARRFTDDEKQLIQAFDAAGVAPRAIHSHLMKICAHDVTRKDIYNVIHTPMQSSEDFQAAIQFLDHHQYWFHIKYSEQYNMESILLTHPDAMKRAGQYASVLLIDCTYNTNKWKLPLFHAIGVDCFNNSFTVAVALLQDETYESYLWCLERLQFLFNDCLLPAVIVTDKDKALTKAIEEVSPESHHLFCLWHIEKNATAKATVELQGENSHLREDFRRFFNAMVFADTINGFNGGS